MDIETFKHAESLQKRIDSHAYAISYLEATSGNVMPSLTLSIADANALKSAMVQFLNEQKQTMEAQFNNL